MEDLITTKQLQELLQVDRTTIYRWLSDGRLTGIRVGGQWRFPHNVVETCLVSPKAAKQIAAAEDMTPSADVLPLDCLQPIQEIFATAADVGAVTTTLDGKPLTPFSNSCKFCDLILASPEGRQRCESSWARLAHSSVHAPRVERCHAGLTYARGRIQVGDEFVGMIFAGQFVTNPSARQELDIRGLARECNVPESALQKAAQEVRVIDPSRADWLLGLLQKVAETFSHIGQQRLDLIMRLRQVAQLAKV